MKKILIVLAVLVVLGILFFGVIALAVGGSYNGLNKLSQATDAQWAQVQNVYQRRADLIPNLVQTVSGAANFEKSTLTQVADARASVGRVTISASSAPADAAQLAEFDKAQGQLGTALSRLMSITENYPQLRATDAFRELQAELEGTENRISVERRDFNTAVQNYDTAVKSFPAVFYAGMFGFKEKPYFAAAPDAQTAPKVQFNFGQPAATNP
jgi:LemA protein